MHRTAVPFHLVHVGDVIDHPSLVGSHSFEVITRVGEEKAGDELNQVILSVGVGGKRHRLEWRPCPDTATSMLDRVGEGCAPTPEGLRSFIAQYLSDRICQKDFPK
jgi:hypothetical protein